jgi:hypothetical protein
MGWDGMGWDGMGWDGMGWDGMGWDGLGWAGLGERFCNEPAPAPLQALRQEGCRAARRTPQPASSRGRPSARCPPRLPQAVRREDPLVRAGAAPRHHLAHAAQQRGVRAAAAALLHLHLHLLLLHPAALHGPASPAPAAGRRRSRRAALLADARPCAHTCSPCAPCAPARRSYFSSDEVSEYVSMDGKHDFGPTHFGLLLGTLRDGLRALSISRCARRAAQVHCRRSRRRSRAHSTLPAQRPAAPGPSPRPPAAAPHPAHRCNDLISSDRYLWSTLSCLSNLRSLSLEDARNALPAASLGCLGRLRHLTELAINSDQGQDAAQPGLSEVPQQWSRCAAAVTAAWRGVACWQGSAGCPRPSGVPRTALAWPAARLLARG